MAQSPFVATDYISAQRHAKHVIFFYMCRCNFFDRVTIVTDPCDIHFEDGGRLGRKSCVTRFLIPFTHAIIGRVRSSHSPTEYSGGVAAIPGKNGGRYGQ